MLGIRLGLVAKHKWRWLVPLMFIVLTAGIALSSKSLLPNSTAAVPAPAILKHATIIDQGVRLEWLESQPGVYPVVGYIIERSRDGKNFEVIGRVEKQSRSYIDNEGRDGNVYRIITEDSRGVEGRSNPSEQISAVPVKPGSNIVVAPAAHSVLGATTVIERAETPEAKGATLQKLLKQTFGAFDTAVTKKDMVVARSQLGILQNYQQEILQLWRQLPSSQKASFAQICDEQLAIFETNLLVMSESDHMDGMLVVAGCGAMQESMQ